MLLHLKTHEAAGNEHSQQLVNCFKRLDIQDQSQETLLATVKQAFGAIIEVKDILVSVAQNVVQVQVMVSNMACIRTLDPTKELPITLEDALGFHVPLPMEFFGNELDWEVSFGTSFCFCLDLLLTPVGPIGFKYAS